MRFRVLCALGAGASVATIWGIDQFKYPSGAASFGISFAVSLIGLAGIFALAGAAIGSSSAKK